MMEKVGKLNFKGFTLASQIRPYLQTSQNNAPHTAIAIVKMTFVNHR